MKSYLVKMPFTGYTTRIIEANSEDEAVSKFFDTTEVETSMVNSNADEHVWEWTRMVTKGNVCYAMLNDCEVEVEDDEEQEEEDEE